MVLGIIIASAVITAGIYGGYQVHQHASTEVGGKASPDKAWTVASWTRKGFAAAWRSGRERRKAWAAHRRELKEFRRKHGRGFQPAKAEPEWSATRPHDWDEYVGVYTVHAGPFTEWLARHRGLAWLARLFEPAPQFRSWENPTRPAPATGQPQQPQAPRNGARPAGDPRTPAKAQPAAAAGPDVVSEPVPDDPADPAHSAGSADPAAAPDTPGPDAAAEPDTPNHREPGDPGAATNSDADAAPASPTNPYLREAPALMTAEALFESADKLASAPLPGLRAIQMHLHAAADGAEQLAQMFTAYAARLDSEDVNLDAVVHDPLRGAAVTEETIADHLRTAGNWVERILAMSYRELQERGIRTPSRSLREGSDGGLSATNTKFFEAAKAMASAPINNVVTDVEAVLDGWAEGFGPIAVYLENLATRLSDKDMAMDPRITDQVHQAAGLAGGIPVFTSNAANALKDILDTALETQIEQGRRPVNERVIDGGRTMPSPAASGPSGPFNPPSSSPNGSTPPNGQGIFPSPVSDPVF